MNEHQQRQPQGIPTGGQFAASARAEAVVDLGAQYRYAGEMDSETRTDFVRGLTNLVHRNIDTAMALTAEADPATRTDLRYHEGLAQGDAMALLLARGEEHHETHVLAWHGHEHLDALTEGRTTRPTPGWAQRSRDIEVDGPLAEDTGRDAANTLVRCALRYAEQHRAAVEHGDKDGEWYSTGALNSVCQHAVSFRDGVEYPDSERVNRLIAAVKDHREPDRLRPEVVDADDATVQTLWDEASGY